MDPGPRHPALGLDVEKKTLGATERDERERQAFRERIRHHPADVFVVVDEMGSNLNLTPRYGRAPSGERARGQVPRNTPPNTTLIAALTLDGIGAAMVLTGATDTIAFTLYVQQFLVPTLSAGQVVIWDNLSAHRSPRVVELLRDAGASYGPCRPPRRICHPSRRPFRSSRRGCGGQKHGANRAYSTRSPPAWIPSRPTMRVVTSPTAAISQHPRIINLAHRCRHPRLHAVRCV